MGKVKKQQVQNNPFESRKVIGGKFTKLCDDMMDSSAWKGLKMNQKGLYVELKKKFTKYSNGDSTQNNISIPKSEAEKMYGDLRTFRKDIDALIEHGFIKCIQSGYTNRTASIYGFSDRWKQYDSPDFIIPLNEKRPPACKLGAKKAREKR